MDATTDPNQHPGARPVNGPQPDGATPGWHGQPRVRWHRHPRALWRRSSDRIIVLPADQDEPLLLEGIGTVIWELLDQPIEVGEMIALLAEAAAEDPQEIGPQVTTFLADLAAEQAITRLDA